MRGFYLKGRISLSLMRACLSQPRKCLCTRTNKTNMKKTTGEEESTRDLDVYRQLDNLDFKTAAKILFTTPPKNKKFGLDFHVVQFFIALMPSLAVYLVAQYAHYEMRKMEAELEVKNKKKEEEEKVKEMEALALEEEKRKSDPELLLVKVRLEALEEAVKEIVVESKKPSSSNVTKDQGGQEKEKPEPSKLEYDGKSEDSKPMSGTGTEPTPEQRKEKSKS